MGLTLNFESDQTAIDNTEAVTFTSIGSGGSSVSVPDAGFYRTGGPLTEDEPSAGAYQRYDATFSIRNSLIGSLGPKPGDTVTRADATVWTVLRASAPVVSGIWQLTCLRLVIAPALAQTGTLSRPNNAQDAAYRPALSSYTTIASNVSCWVEPIETAAEDVMQRRTMVTSAVAYLATAVDAQANDQFIVGTTKYTVLKSSKPSRLDKLQELELEVVT